MSNSIYQIRLLKQINIFIYTFFFLSSLVNIFQYKKTYKDLYQLDDGRDDVDDDHNDSRKRKRRKK